MLAFREATRADLPALVAMLADDPLGAAREDPSLPLDPRYLDAFDAILADPNNELIVVDRNGELAGSLQLTFIPYINRLGSWRCMVEAVRVHKSARGQGLGTEIFGWVEKRARERGCSLIQLTSDKARPDAIRFYERLGYEASHEGLKRKL